MSLTAIELSTDIEVQLVDHSGSDLSVVKAARVSNIAEAAEAVTTMEDREKGLINYLMKNKHGTPFEHAYMEFFVRAPIFVFREWMRHRIGISYNEESARYRQLKPRFYVPSKERPLRQEGTPGKYRIVMGDEVDLLFATRQMMKVYEVAYETYVHMLDHGIAREVARNVLPVGIFSSMYVSFNPRSMMNFLGLRTHVAEANHPSYPQYEIEVAARKLETFFAELFPVTHASWNANGREAP